ncbi:MAG: alanine--tRNA ligase, partial [Calditrichaeota bacterium]|nr:alanine--tRNA ligase [Calditrichota bacterium]
TDTESFEIWKNKTDIDPSHILYFGDKDNFWEMGATGPCGPCSEIHYDRKFDHSLKGDDPKHGVNAGNEQFIEIWNLVFIQFFKDQDQSLSELPAKHVDTGMGFERIVSILQDKDSNYKTDIFTPLIEALKKISKVPYNEESQAAYHVAVDHIRTLSFSIADGALPSNEGRGYVLRRMLRRASRYGRKLGFHEPFLYRLVDTLADQMSFYPELAENKDFIKKAIKAEEEQFNNTLDKGLTLFDELLSQLKSKKLTEISGTDAFKLYDTFGFPLDLTEVLAKENNLTVDTDSFENEMEKQRERARKASNFGSVGKDKREWITVSKDKKSSVFRGYELLEMDSEIKSYSLTDSTLYIELTETPFYAESGGQVADQGVISCKDQTFSVTDVQKEGDRIIHIVANCNELPKQTEVHAKVVESERRSTANNHTATHLLHQALKDVLGTHIKQAGSLVDSKHFRFDFNHFEKVSDQQLKEIEDIVNTEILKNTSLTTEIMPFDKAISDGAVALFGEKYGDTVRVVSVPPFSKELCGGTHVQSTGQIGSFKITSESSIAAGTRRIEGITGWEAYRYNQQIDETLKQMQDLLNVGSDQLLSKIDSILAERKRLDKELETLKESEAINRAKNLIDKTTDINGVQTVIERLDGVNAGALKNIGGQLIQNRKNTLIAIGSAVDDKVALMIAVSPDLTEKYQAGKLVAEIAKITGGGGGGRPDLATAGGKDVSQIDAALKHLKSMI